MILIAVIVGYALGVAPFIFYKILSMLENKKENSPVSIMDEQTFDEWINGPKVENSVNAEDIYKEYVTGTPSAKGGN